MDSEKQLADLEKRLQQVYQKAKVGEEWTAYMEKASKEIKPLQTAYETAKKGNDAEARAQAAKALVDKKREMTVTDAHYRYLTDTLAKEISGLNEEAAALINDELPGAYALNYNGTVTELASKAPGYSFEMVDTKTINALAKTDTTLLPYKYIDGKKDVRWNTQAVNTQVLQGITQGESMKEIAARLNHVVGMDLKSAIRNARVAVSGAQNRGRMDMLRNARDKGVHTVKVWSAIHDNRTRDAHILLDGEEAEIDEPFDSELGEIMYPFDPDADPANVYNCRCRLEYKVVGFDDAKGKGDDEAEEAEIEYATNREEAYSLLKDKVGFHEVSQSLKYIDEETIVAQANQLAKLNAKFGAIGENYTGYIGAENSKTFAAAVRGSFISPDNQSLIFSNDVYAHGFSRVVSDVKKEISSGFLMPALEENYGVYTVTHEYGHILQNVIMADRVDLEKYNADREVIGFNPARLAKLRDKTITEAGRSIFAEILDIAKESNPNFSIKGNISGYGKSNYGEAFAEVFANSQLGTPNELGNAMLEWLKRQGY